MELTKLFEISPYGLNKSDKQSALFPLISSLHQSHLDRSDDFRRIISSVFGESKTFKSIDQLPFIPVSTFKNHSLKSIGNADIFKTLTSSGTTGQAVSRIYLDRDTAKLQTLGLSKILTHILGNERLPMLIIDSKSILSNKSSFSARGAGVLGLSVFGKDHTYVLDDNFDLDEALLLSFLEKYSGKRILIFGFTFMVWQYLYNVRLKRNYDLSNAILVHSGGWKRLVDIAVDNNVFREKLKEKFNLSMIYNFYGMVEQVGSVFLENASGYLNCPNFAEVIIRNPKDFSVQPIGEPGLVQVLSALPLSYPGHSLLTEDIGVLVGEDNDLGGWNGKYFKILGRAKKAELRGCSDTFKL